MVRRFLKRVSGSSPSVRCVSAVSTFSRSFLCRLWSISHSIGTSKQCAHLEGRVLPSPKTLHNDKRLIYLCNNLSLQCEIKAEVVAVDLLSAWSPGLRDASGIFPPRILFRELKITSACLWARRGAVALSLSLPRICAWGAVYCTSRLGQLATLLLECWLAESTVSKIV